MGEGKQPTRKCRFEPGDLPGFMLQRSAENRHLRPAFGTFKENPRMSPVLAPAKISDLCGLSRRSFTSGLLCLVSTHSLFAQQAPHRIVSTAPSITEALFALGVGSQVVGVSQYCDFPLEVANLPKVGSYIRPNLEAIVRLKPDLVILQTGAAEVPDRLKALNIPFIEVPHGTLNDVFSAIEMIAKSAGVGGRSTGLVSSIQDSLRSIRTKSHTMPSASVIAIVDRRQGTLTDLTAVGPGNYLNEMLEIAGGNNALAKPGLPRYPHISIETIIREDPDVILDLTNMQDSEAKRTAERPALLALWQQNQTLKAARNGRVYFGTSNVLLVPGPRAPKAAEMLFEFMHGSGGRMQG
jgi:iron complex transport system substrate-binding protein